MKGLIIAGHVPWYFCQQNIEYNWGIWYQLVRKVSNRSSTTTTTTTITTPISTTTITIAVIITNTTTTNSTTTENFIVELDWCFYRHTYFLKKRKNYTIREKESVWLVDLVLIFFLISCALFDEDNIVANMIAGPVWWHPVQYP